jgi:hypothetical protein
MDLIETIANDPEFFVEMDFRPGDIQLSTMPSSCTREEYDDHDERRAQAPSPTALAQRDQLCRRRGCARGGVPSAADAPR